MKLNELSITSARKGLRNKEFSSVELALACLDQIETLDKYLNAFITVCKKEVLEDAKKADTLIGAGDNRPLLGIPAALKDIYSTKAIKTTAASNVLKDYVPLYDATVVKKIKDAGALIIGKTNLDAWAHGSSGENSDFGPTKNPYNLEYVPGGSSSGSAAALAAGMCLTSTGTDTGGSIRLPASFTNTVGLKPTYGRVSRYGVISMASSMDSIGHFTKTVEDSALMLSVTCGHDAMDATTPPHKTGDYLSEIKKDIKGLRIGIPKEYVSEGLDADVKNCFNNAYLQALQSLGAEFEEISLPHTQYAIACYYIIQPAEVSSNLARFDGVRFGNDRNAFGEEAKRRIMLGTFTLSAGYYEAYYKKAMQVRTLVKQDFDKAFKKVDAIIAPVSPTSAWKIGEKVNDPLQMYLSDALTVPINLAGLPALCVPIGFTQNKLPVGMQIIGPQFCEDLLFRIGHNYQQATEWHKKRINITL